MADPLSTEEAKAALADLARGGPARNHHPTPEQAKRKLRDTARGTGLRRLARTRPLLAATVALGYGLILGGGPLRAEEFRSLVNRVLTAYR